jgi:hypothetical protein
LVRKTGVKEVALASLYTSAGIVVRTTKINSNKAQCRDAIKAFYLDGGCEGLPADPLSMGWGVSVLFYLCLPFAN